MEKLKNAEFVQEIGKGLKAIFSKKRKRAGKLGEEEGYSEH